MQCKIASEILCVSFVSFSVRGVLTFYFYLICRMLSWKEQTKICCAIWKKKTDRMNWRVVNTRKKSPNFVEKWKVSSRSFKI